MELEMSTSEVTHSGSNGWREHIVTVKGGKGTATVPWDSTDTSWLAIGNEITNMALKMGGSSLTWTVATAIITNVGYAIDNQNGHVVANVSWLGSGSITGPS